MPDALNTLHQPCVLLLQHIPTETQYAESIWSNIWVMLLVALLALVRAGAFGSRFFSRNRADTDELSGWLNGHTRPSRSRLTAPPLRQRSIAGVTAGNSAPPPNPAALAYQAQIDAWLAERGMSPQNGEHIALAVQANPYDPAEYARRAAAMPVQYAAPEQFEQHNTVHGLAVIRANPPPSNIALALGLAAPEPRSAVHSGPPLSPPQQLQELLWMYGEPWWVAGGWALELWLGRELRPHSDIEISIPRADQLALRAYLTQFRFTQIVKDEQGTGREQPLPAGEAAEPPVHELHARRYSGAGIDPLALLRFEVLLSDVEDGVWRYRRDPRVTLPLEQFCGISAAGIPYLAPQVVLLYKAGSSAGLRPVDEQDFAAALPQLAAEQRAWLAQALATAHPGHSWLARR